jgi:predicted methyltransferase
MKVMYIVAAAALLLGGQTAGADTAALEKAATGAHRDPANIARNAWRHPVETLSFFGIRDDMTVVEVWPGRDGWYTEILAPYLREKGVLYAANFDGSTGVEYFEKGAAAFREKLAAKPGIYDRVRVTALMPPKALEAAPPGSADLVVTFRNLHNWVSNDIAEAMFKAMYDALKPGGTLGLVAHRGTDTMVGKEAAKTGYLAESEAVRLAEAAGFKLVDRSEINANPKDTRDHAGGVWSLPPNFRLGDQDREKYAAIGESDRMTLRFVKP